MISAGEYDITHYYDVGDMGIEHALLPEKGLFAPGDCVIGADSHTCTYGALGAFSTGIGSTDMCAGMAKGKTWFKVPAAIKFNITGKLPEYSAAKDVILHIIGMIGVDGALYKSMEFSGEGLKNLSMEDRLCMANMAIEAGAKNGIFAVDEVTLDYIKDKVNKEYKIYEADADAEYEAVYDICMMISSQPLHSLICLKMQKLLTILMMLKLIRWLSDHVQTAELKI